MLSVEQQTTLGTSHSLFLGGFIVLLSVLDLQAGPVGGAHTVSAVWTLLLRVLHLL